MVVMVVVDNGDDDDNTAATNDDYKNGDEEDNDNNYDVTDDNGDDDENDNDNDDYDFSWKFHVATKITRYLSLFSQTRVLQAHPFGTRYSIPHGLTVIKLWSFQIIGPFPPMRNLGG